MKFITLILELHIWLSTMIILTAVDTESLMRNEIAILQYDSRPLKQKSYWLSSALWNQHYCELHDHIFIYYTADKPCAYDSTNPLASPWCKVKAMIQANEDYPQVKVFVYMDSDAVIDKYYEKLPMNTMLKVIQTRLNWDPLDKPMIFNQDGPCWWCSLIKRVGYDKCLNAGTVLWYRHENSERVLWDWWHASMDDYATNPIKRYVIIELIE